VNIAFRRARLTARGGFHGVGELEFARGKFVIDDGTGLTNHFTTAGGRVVYDPLAAVTYAVPAERLTQDWFRSKASWKAVAELARSGSLTPEEATERWQRVKDFFFACPPAERTIRALVLSQNDPKRFQEQISAVYDTLSCLLSGIGEADYD
jgi:hypothetical protein